MSIHVEAEIQEAWDDTPNVPTSLYEARALMLEDQQLEREQAAEDELFERIMQDYDASKAKRRARRDLVRQCLLQYVQHHGKAAVPDVGTAFATTRKPHVQVVDNDIAVNVARELDPDGTDGLWRPTVSRTNLKARAQQHLEDTGEILPGCELAPETTSLTIRHR